MKLRTTLLISCLLIQLSLLQGQTLTAILFNAPGADNGFETVQIEGNPGASLSGLWFIAIEADGSGAGIVDQAVDLGSLSPNTIGTNGLFLLRDAAGGWNPSPPAGTNIAVRDFTPDIENGSNTFLLVSGFTGSTGDDLDTDNDGTLDATPWTSVLSAVANLDSNAEPEYATQLGGAVVNLLGCAVFTDPGFIFFAGGMWNGTVPQTGTGGTLIYSTTQTFDASCNDLSATYGGSTIVFGELDLLPVEWSYFRGQRQQQDVMLYWGTASEINHDYFEVQRSRDGRRFEAIGRIYSEEEGRSEGGDYQYVDQNAPQQTLYYRLRQVDVDGSYSSSSLLSISGQPVKTELLVFPNPTNGELTIDGLAGPTQIRLYNQLGALLLEQELNQELVPFRLQLPQQLSGQIVYLVMNQGDAQESRRIRVE